MRASRLWSRLEKDSSTLVQSRRLFVLVCCARAWPLRPVPVLAADVPATSTKCRFHLLQSSQPLRRVAAEGSANRQRPRLLLGRSVFYPHLNATMPIFPLPASFEAISFCHFHFTHLLRAPQDPESSSCRCHATTRLVCTVQEANKLHCAETIMSWR